MIMISVDPMQLDLDKKTIPDYFLIIVIFYMNLPARGTIIYIVDLKVELQ